MRKDAGVAVGGCVGPEGARLAGRIYDSARRTNPALEQLQELYRYRDLVRLMISSQVKTRYRRSAIGIGWILIQPLLSAGVLSVAFAQVFDVRVPNYPIYAMTGLLAWNLFAQVSIGGVDAIASGGALANRMYVPHSAYVVAAAGNGLMNLFLALLPLALVMAAMRVPIPITWALFPLAAAVGLAFSLGVALLISTAAVFVNDAAHIYQAVVPLLFFLTPIAYPIESLSPRVAWIVHLNPMHYVSTLFRAVLFEGRLPGVGTVSIAVGIALATLLLGWLAFSRNADRFSIYV